MNPDISLSVDTHPSEVFIEGRWQSAPGDTIALVNPATEEMIGDQLAAAPEAVAGAVSAARAAHARGEWAHAALEERIAVIERASELLVPRLEELALVQTMQMGAPLTVSRMMIGSCRGLLDAYIAGARRIDYRYLRRDGGKTALMRREPVGVVAAITPWNGPLATVVNKVVPALLCGCSVVLKPAPETPLEGGIFAEVCTAAGLPDGVLNVVTGDAATGGELVAHPDVDKLSFTGSTAVGRLIGEACGSRFVRTSLELGGKSAGVILPDADLETTIPQVVTGNFFNTGQACTAITRVLVPAAHHDAVLNALTEAARAMVIGDPMDEATELGPLVTRNQRERVEGYVAAGLDGGARLACGGRKPSGLDRGWYYEPTIFAGVENTMRIAREEIFGPVLSLIPYETEDEAVAIANDCDYDLHGAVFTSDPAHGLEVAGRMRAGSVSINAFGLSPATPYGGLRRSGIGREHGREGVEEFLELRSFVIPEELAAESVADGVSEG